MATNYSINYNDSRFTEVEEDKREALSELEQVYSGMINQSDKYYQAQIDASKEWADKQTALQQEQTDFTIEKIEQQKEQAEKDYIKEQSASYVDWQKQSNQYGANAEQIAAQGMANSGYSESSQVSMYNTYQNRVATARDSYNRAILNYNNAIKDARLQNNAALAEIAYQALQQQLELSLEGFQYKNSLVMAQADKKMEIDNMYYARYQDVLQQINTENALAESIRQYEQNYALQVKEYEEGVRQFNAEMALAQERLAEEKRQFNVVQASKSSGGGGGGGGGNSVPRLVPDTPEVEDGKKVKVDYASLSAAGVPLAHSAEYIDGLVKSGKIIEYEKDGTLYYKKGSPTVNLNELSWKAPLTGKKIVSTNNKSRLPGVR